MLKGICILPVIPMRQSQSDKSEMINQVLFGESFKILDKTKKWTFIELDHDNYKGWIDNKQYQELEDDNSNVRISNKKSCIIKINKIKQPLLLGSFIPMNKKIRTKISLEEELSFCKMFPFETWFMKICKKYLNTPYLWGGRSPLGIDCSGYTQMVYRFFNQQLPRDSHEQEKKGKEILYLKQSKMGDLVFFKNNNRINHVGIILKNNRIIHASGKVRIDILDEKGILNIDSKIYTHQLNSIKRLI
mgnify:CR=1 FL=1